jgi:small subunit ribosomal protein S17
MTETTAEKRRLSGRVVSAKMQKTLTVLVERTVKHPVYGKVLRRSKKYHAHYDTGAYAEGDMVIIEETRPIAKTKAWRVAELIQKARGV